MSSPGVPSRSSTNAKNNDKNAPRLNEDMEHFRAARAKWRQTPRKPLQMMSTTPLTEYTPKQTKIVSTSTQKQGLQSGAASTQMATAPTTISTSQQQQENVITQNKPNSHRDRLLAFYQKYNPSKVDSVDATLLSYKGKEELLFKKLEQKYVTGKDGILPPGGSGPKCFMDFTIGGQLVGRVTMQLYQDKTPLACENFRALCTGEKGLGRAGKTLSYKGCSMHRIVPNFCIQGGDFTKGDGTGGESIYSPGLPHSDMWGKFKDETPFMQHSRKGLLSMANNGPNRNGSQFFFTLKNIPHLDGKHVVFGEVTDGMDVLEKIADIQTDSRQRPTNRVVIENCGVLDNQQHQAVDDTKNKSAFGFGTFSSTATATATASKTSSKSPFGSFGSASTTTSASSGAAGTLPKPSSGSIDTNPCEGLSTAFQSFATQADIGGQSPFNNTQMTSKQLLDSSIDEPKRSTPSPPIHRFPPTPFTIGTRKHRSPTRSGSTPSKVVSSKRLKIRSRAIITPNATKKNDSETDPPPKNNLLPTTKTKLATEPSPSLTSISSTPLNSVRQVQSSYPPMATKAPTPFSNVSGTQVTGTATSSKTPSTPFGGFASTQTTNKPIFSSSSKAPTSGFSFKTQQSTGSTESSDATTKTIKAPNPFAKISLKSTAPVDFSSCKSTYSSVTNQSEKNNKIESLGNTSMADVAFTSLTMSSKNSSPFGNNLGSFGTSTSKSTVEPVQATKQSNESTPKVSSSYPPLSSKAPTPFGSTSQPSTSKATSVTNSKSAAQSSSYPPMATKAPTPFSNVSATQVTGTATPSKTPSTPFGGISSTQTTNKPIFSSSSKAPTSGFSFKTQQSTTTESTEFSDATTKTSKASSPFAKISLKSTAPVDFSSCKSSDSSVTNQSEKNNKIESLGNTSMADVASTSPTMSSKAPTLFCNNLSSFGASTSKSTVEPIQATKQSNESTPKVSSSYPPLASKAPTPFRSTSQPSTSKATSLTNSKSAAQSSSYPPMATKAPTPFSNVSATQVTRTATPSKTPSTPFGGISSTQTTNKPIFSSSSKAPTSGFSFKTQQSTTTESTEFSDATTKTSKASSPFAKISLKSTAPVDFSSCKSSDSSVTNQSEKDNKIESLGNTSVADVASTSLTMSSKNSSPFGNNLGSFGASTSKATVEPVQATKQSNESTPKVSSSYPPLSSKAPTPFGSTSQPSTSSNGTSTSADHGNVFGVPRGPAFGSGSAVPKFSFSNSSGSLTFAVPKGKPEASSTTKSPFSFFGSGQPGTSNATMAKPLFGPSASANTSISDNKGQCGITKEDKNTPESISSNAPTLSDNEEIKDLSGKDGFHIAAATFDSFDASKTKILPASKFEELVDDLGEGFYGDERNAQLAIIDPDGKGTITRSSFIGWYCDLLGSFKNGDDLSLDSEEVAERAEEKENAEKAFLAMATGQGLDRIIESSEFGKLMESMGTTYCEDEHRKTVKKLCETNGTIKMDKFITWYVNWLFCGDTTDDEASNTDSDNESDKFNDSQTVAGDSCVAAKDNWGDTFKVDTDSWKCESCMVRNSGDVTSCAACEAMRPGCSAESVISYDRNDNVNGDSTVASSSIGASGFKFGGTAAADSNQSTSSFSFGTSTSGSTATAAETTTAGSFTFGTTANPDTNAVLFGASTGFTFGTKVEKSAEVMKPFGFSFRKPSIESSDSAKDDATSTNISTSKNSWPTMSTNEGTPFGGVPSTSKTTSEASPKPASKKIPCYHPLTSKEPNTVRSLMDPTTLTDDKDSNNKPNKDSYPPMASKPPTPFSSTNASVTISKSVVQSSSYPPMATKAPTPFSNVSGTQATTTATSSKTPSTPFSGFVSTQTTNKPIFSSSSTAPTGGFSFRTQQSTTTESTEFSDAATKTSKAPNPFASVTASTIAPFNLSSSKTSIATTTTSTKGESIVSNSATHATPSPIPSVRSTFDASLKMKTVTSAGLVGFVYGRGGLTYGRITTKSSFQKACKTADEAYAISDDLEAHDQESSLQVGRSSQNTLDQPTVLGFTTDSKSDIPCSEVRVRDVSKTETAGMLGFIYRKEGLTFGRIIHDNPKKETTITKYARSLQIGRSSQNTLDQPTVLGFTTVSKSDIPCSEVHVRDVSKTETAGMLGFIYKKEGLAFGRIDHNNPKKETTITKYARSTAPRKVPHAGSSLNDQEQNSVMIGFTYGKIGLAFGKIVCDMNLNKPQNRIEPSVVKKTTEHESPLSDKTDTCVLAPTLQSKNTPISNGPSSLQDNDQESSNVCSHEEETEDVETLEEQIEAAEDEEDIQMLLNIIDTCTKHYEDDEYADVTEMALDAFYRLSKGGDEMPGFISSTQQTILACLQAWREEEAIVEVALGCLASAAPTMDADDSEFDIIVELMQAFSDESTIQEQACLAIEALAKASAAARDNLIAADAEEVLLAAKGRITNERNKKYPGLALSALGIEASEITEPSTFEAAEEDTQGDADGGGVASTSSSTGAFTFKPLTKSELSSGKASSSSADNWGTLFSSQDIGPTEGSASGFGSGLKFQSSSFTSAATDGFTFGGVSQSNEASKTGFSFSAPKKDAGPVIAFESDTKPSSSTLTNKVNDNSNNAADIVCQEKELTISDEPSSLQDNDQESSNVCSHEEETEDVETLEEQIEAAEDEEDIQMLLNIIDTCTKHYEDNEYADVTEMALDAFYRLSKGGDEMPGFISSTQQTILACLQAWREEEAIVEVALGCLASAAPTMDADDSEFDIIVELMQAFSDESTIQEQACLAIEALAKASAAARDNLIAADAEEVLLAAKDRITNERNKKYPGLALSALGIEASEITEPSTFEAAEEDTQGNADGGEVASTSSSTGAFTFKPLTKSELSSGKASSSSADNWGTLFSSQDIGPTEGSASGFGSGLKFQSSSFTSAATDGFTFGGVSQSSDASKTGFSFSAPKKDAGPIIAFESDTKPSSSTLTDKVNDNSNNAADFVCQEKEPTISDEPSSLQDNDQESSNVCSHEEETEDVETLEEQIEAAEDEEDIQMLLNIIDTCTKHYEDNEYADVTEMALDAFYRLSKGGDEMPGFISSTQQTILACLQAWREEEAIVEVALGCLASAAPTMDADDSEFDIIVELMQAFSDESTIQEQACLAIEALAKASAAARDNLIAADAEEVLLAAKGRITNERNKKYPGLALSALGIEASEITEPSTFEAAEEDTQGDANGGGVASTSSSTGAFTFKPLTKSELSSGKASSSSADNWGTLFSSQDIGPTEGSASGFGSGLKFQSSSFTSAATDGFTFGGVSQSSEASKTGFSFSAPKKDAGPVITFESDTKPSSSTLTNKVNDNSNNAADIVCQEKEPTISDEPSSLQDNDQESSNVCSHEEETEDVETLEEQIEAAEDEEDIQMLLNIIDTCTKHYEDNEYADVTEMALDAFYRLSKGGDEMPGFISSTQQTILACLQAWREEEAIVEVALGCLASAAPTMDADDSEFDIIVELMQAFSDESTIQEQACLAIEALAKASAAARDNLIAADAEEVLLAAKDRITNERNKKYPGLALSALGMEASEITEPSTFEAAEEDTQGNADGGEVASTSSSTGAFTFKPLTKSELSSGKASSSSADNWGTLFSSQDIGPTEGSASGFGSGLKFQSSSFTSAATDGFTFGGVSQSSGASKAGFSFSAPKKDAGPVIAFESDTKPSSSTLPHKVNDNAANGFFFEAPKQDKTIPSKIQAPSFNFSKPNASPAILFDSVKQGESFGAINRDDRKVNVKLKNNVDEPELEEEADKLRFIISPRESKIPTFGSMNRNQRDEAKNKLPSSELGATTKGAMASPRVSKMPSFASPISSRRLLSSSNTTEGDAKLPRPTTSTNDTKEAKKSFDSAGTALDDTPGRDDMTLQSVSTTASKNSQSYSLELWYNNSAATGSSSCSPERVRRQQSGSGMNMLISGVSSPEGGGAESGFTLSALQRGKEEGEK